RAVRRRARRDHAQPRRALRGDRARRRRRLAGALPPGVSRDVKPLAHLGLGHVRVDRAQLGIAPGAAGTRYREPARPPPLRDAVAAWRGADPGEVAITTGASLGLVATLCTLPRPASVLVPRPSYSAYAQVLALLGLELVTYDLDRDRAWRISTESVARGI